jgi:hypothetical protein
MWANPFVGVSKGPVVSGKESRRGTLGYGRQQKEDQQEGREVTDTSRASEALLH